MPGESLTSIAAADGMSVSQLAAANGLSPTSELTTGSGIQIPPQLGGSVGSPSAPAATASASAATPSATGSDFVHTVLPGESLTSIAAADGLSVSQLAAANGLSPTAELISGAGIQIPGQSGGGVASSSAPAAASASSGSYVVQPGDTLTAIAAADGTSVQQLAADNGLNPLGVLPAGMVLNVSGGGGTASGQPTSSDVASSQPVGSAAEGTPTNPPYPTMQTVSPSEVGSIAASNGVPPALAQAIADQESGFNNNEVSTSDARGVMQILPGTWNYIQQDLTPGASPLAPASATDNVRGGVELLHSLLNATGGNAAMAAAGYYQGLPSVEANGLYPSTQQYVNDVLSLQQQFNGGG
jgi:LysM repeat protein